MHQLIKSCARLTALVGGLVLVGLIIMTTLSVLGRSADLGEIKGNYEILEAGIAFAIFSFLPITQFYGAHATVGVFTDILGPRVNRWIAAFWEVVLAAVIVLVIWRLYEGMQRYLGNGETTLFLEFPVWWAYGASFAAGVVACITAVYCAAARIAEALGDRSILPSEHGEH